MIIDQLNPLTTSNYILYAPKLSYNIQHAKIHELRCLKETYKDGIVEAVFFKRDRSKYVS